MAATFSPLILTVHYGEHIRTLDSANWHSFLCFSVIWDIFEEVPNVQELQRWDRDLRENLIANKYAILSHTKENEVLSKNILIDHQSTAERGSIT